MLTRSLPLAVLPGDTTQRGHNTTMVNFICDSFTLNYLIRTAVQATVLVLLFSVAARSQTIYDSHESERSDKLTGGHIIQAEFVPGEPDLQVTLNVPSFRLTLWQNGKEVKSYFVGVGMKDYPIYIGEREATEVIWNPPWIPPNSSWVGEHKGVRPGETIKASDPRNPLGKLKIPLGDNYLIHQAAKTTDLGNLVSHGCVRMLRSDLYDLAEKIIAAKSVPISRKRIEAAKRSSQMLAVRLDDPIPVKINYDTLVVEDGVLHIYPDVYDRKLNVPSRVRVELQSSGVNISRLDEESIKEMLSKVTRRTQFIVEKSSIEQGRALEDGRTIPLIGSSGDTAPAKRKKTPRTR
jgi:lipoprotein-anchoring transpeptidase ErfK/SrfK